MYSLFTQEDLEYNIIKASDGIVVKVSSDYSGSERKSQLYVRGDRLAQKIESFWKSIKTKKLFSISLSFDEIDWYDSMTDIYETPIIHMKRGLRKAKIGTQEHGSIPKDWGVDVTFCFKDIKTITPVIEVMEKAMRHWFTSDIKKRFTKEYRLVVNGKKKSSYISTDY